MKTKYFCKTGILAALPIGFVAGFGILTAQAEEGTLDYTGTLGLGAGGAFTKGNNAAFQRRTQQDGDFYGGLSNLHAETEKGDVLYTLDGHAMFGNYDHEFILGAVKEGTGYLEVGYSEFRTWYDGSGGYLPGGSPEWAPAANEELHLDRGKVWLEAGLRQEDQPEYTFRYTHSWREGQKDSTMWGRNSPGIFPTLNNIDEQSDRFEFDVAHTIGITDLGMGLSYEVINNNNDRVILEKTTHYESYDADLFNAHASSVSRLNEQMMLSFGYAFTTMDTDTDGSFRETSTGLSGHDFWNNVGGGAFKSHVANANFWWNPTDNLVIVPSIRYEHETQDAIGQFFEQPHKGAPENLRESQDSEYDSVTEQIELRYTGCDNLLLYTKVLANQTNGDVLYNSLDLADPLDPHHRNKDVDSTSEKYIVGATWYALRDLSLAAEYFHKDYDSDYTNELHGFDAHLASHDISTDDINVRMTWRALPNLTLVTRYDWQDTAYDSKGIDGSDTVLGEIESGQSQRNVLSQSVTYLPTQSLYLTGYVSYTWADTETAASNAASNLATFDNDYLTANLTAGYALDEKTDITVGYSYYYAENFVVPTGAVGYGTDLEEHVFNIGLNRQLSDSMLLNVGYAYYTSNDGTSGGNNDFDAHMLSSGLQVSF